MVMYSKGGRLGGCRLGMEIIMLTTLSKFSGNPT